MRVARTSRVSRPCPARKKNNIICKTHDISFLKNIGCDIYYIYIPLAPSLRPPKRKPPKNRNIFKSLSFSLVPAGKPPKYKVVTDLSSGGIKVRSSSALRMIFAARGSFSPWKPRRSLSRSPLPLGTPNAPNG